jgi:organic hydroperoxide reductase OsmC/OhrA
MCLARITAEITTMTADEHVARANVELTERFQFTTTFPDVAGAAPLTIDEQPPLGDGAGPNPAALVAAAVSGCLAASFTFCLRKARTEPEAVSAHAVAHIVRNEAGRFRIGHIDVEMTVRVAEADRWKLTRCEQLFEDFCIVTESVRRGIPVTVKVRTPADDAVASLATA